MLGRLYRVSNNSVEAEKAYNAGAQGRPDNEDALTGLAMLYADLGDNAAGHREAEGGHRQEPQRAHPGGAGQRLRADPRLQERRRGAASGRWSSRPTIRGSAAAWRKDLM